MTREPWPRLNRAAFSLEHMTPSKRLSMLVPRMQRHNGRTVELPPKKVDDWYHSQEHIAWSQEVRKRAGFVCEKCGDNEGRLFADHINELKDGGDPLDLSNGQCLCASCHTIKTIRERATRL